MTRGIRTQSELKISEYNITLPPLRWLRYKGINNTKWSGEGGDVVTLLCCQWDGKMVMPLAKTV